MKLLRPIGFLFLALALQACAGFSNRLAPTEACDKLLVASWYRFFGITTEIDPKDAETRLQKCLRDKARP